MKKKEEKTSEPSPKGPQPRINDNNDNNNTVVGLLLAGNLSELCYEIGVRLQKITE